MHVCLWPQSCLIFLVLLEHLYQFENCGSLRFAWHCAIEKSCQQVCTKQAPLLPFFLSVSGDHWQQNLYQSHISSGSICSRAWCKMLVMLMSWTWIWTTSAAYIWFAQDYMDAVLSRNTTQSIPCNHFSNNVMPTHTTSKWWSPTYQWEIKQKWEPLRRKWFGHSDWD